jgi:EAL domain-containing protein (putative c-di-GMP-specific phosphodiesterase class I)
VIVGLVQKYDIRPQNLHLEITETSVTIEVEERLSLIKRLQEKGFILEMDDFGSGYSSLNMLKDISVDVLKVDMEFLNETTDRERSRKILGYVIGLAKDLGMETIVEGVETAEQVEFLRNMHCDKFQGYYFAKPMRAEEFERIYMEGEVES